MLEVSSPQTRGFWGRLGRICLIGVADIGGAEVGVKVGGALGALGGPVGAVAGGAIGGMIVGCVASYAASETSQQEEEVDDTIFETVYCDPLIFYRAAVAYESDIFSNEIDDTRSLHTRSEPFEPSEYDVNIDIPEDYSDCEDIAIMHNEALALILTGETFRDIEVTDPIAQQFASEVFLKDYQSMIDNIRKSSRELETINFDSYFANTVPGIYSPITNSILKLFYDIYTKYPQKIEDIDFIVNYYIKTISSEITDQEKKSLITALAVAAYSPRFWIERLNVDEN